MKPIKFILIFIILNQTTNCQTANEIYQSLLKIYKNVIQVSFDFNLIEEGIQGHLIAKKGNKYKITIGDREIICNGKTVWNYSKSDKKVFINDFEENEDQVSIDKIFFSFLNSFEPIKLTEINKSDGTNAYVLTLKTNETFRTTLHINSVKITVHKETFDILEFQISEPQKMTWEIKKMQLRKKADDKIFEFQIPEGIEVIDLR